MKKYSALVVCLLLAGCTDADWDHALNYVYPPADDADVISDAAPQPATPAATTTAATNAATSAAPAPAMAAQPANADFCRAVATQDANENGFDPATQQRVFARSYGQCVAIYAR
jgi:hypothetical protein